MKPIAYTKPVKIDENLGFVFFDAGHIMGSSIVQFSVMNGRGQEHSLVFSGDLGRSAQPILNDPKVSPYANTLVLESTYGDRDHPRTDPKAQLTAIINDAAVSGSVVLIPAFAVGRTQHILYLLREMEDSASIPILPVYLDSPMADAATSLYRKYVSSLDSGVRRVAASGRNPFATANFHILKTTEESKTLNSLDGPMVVIAGSGMATGGRILHHLKQRLPSPKTTVVFVGFQAEETRGRRLLNGEPELKMLGKMVRVRARIKEITGLSSHAGQSEILDWLNTFASPPERIFLIHGEPPAQEALQKKVRKQLGWSVEAARYLESISI